MVRSFDNSPDPADAGRGPRGPARLATAAERILGLQRTAGNAAVTRALLARQGSGSGTLVLPPLSGTGGEVPGLGAALCKPIPDDVAGEVKNFLQTRQVAIGIRVQEGSISMPEVVAMVRQQCPASLRIEPFQVETLVSEVMGIETPPPRRKNQTADGARAEIEALIANALPKPPTKVSLTSKYGALVLSLDGAQINTKIAGVKVQAKAGTSSGSIEGSSGSVSVKGEASFQGDSVGVSTKVGDVSFGAKLQKDKDTWSKWSMELTIPVIGEASDAVPPADQLRDAVVKADAAVARVIAHLEAGGSPTDDVVKQALDDIKPAIDAIDKATSKPKGPSVTVKGTASGSSSGWSVGVSVVITF